MPGLIVSVRTCAEAKNALAGGATLLDVKEPRLGSLGRAADREINAVVALFASRVPVSAAMGELRETPELPPRKNLAYVKWGLSGFGALDWSAALKAVKIKLERQRYSSQPVVVAYADWQRA